ncbi:hypothetical protein ACFYY8_33775 [Streptosporangium sp. NPDC001559]|uniref:hypothetical protein n=1 Tax=Streptosporangium sp. NPDC001559 TaxID=3366187 RepID=UPI0036EFDE53
MGDTAYLTETTTEEIGKPVAGELVQDEHGPRVSIALGPRRALWTNDSAWLRALASAAGAGANVLDAITHTGPVWTEGQLLQLARALYSVVAASTLPSDSPARVRHLDAVREEVMDLLADLTDEQRMDVAASWRDRNTTESPATPVEVEEPLGLRASAVGHPPYIDPTPTGVHPVLNPGADQ